MSRDYRVRFLKDEEYDRWSTFNRTADGGSIYADPLYLTALASAANERFSICGVFNGDELCGGLPLYQRNIGSRRTISNRLLLYYLSPVLQPYEGRYPSEATSRQLLVLSKLEEFIRQQSYDRITLHVRATIADVRPFLTAAWQVTPSYSYLVDFANLDAAWQRVEKNLRRLITRAEESGLTLSKGDDFESFYRLHRETHERKGAPLYLPEPMFESFISSLRAQGLGELYFVRNASGEALASQLVLLGKYPESHTVTAGASKDAMRLGSTPFLRWKAFEELSKSGYQANDLTDAALNSVTHFKSQLGGELKRNLVIKSCGTISYQVQQLAESSWRKFKASVREIIAMSSEGKSTHHE